MIPKNGVISIDGNHLRCIAFEVLENQRMSLRELVE